MSQRGIGEPDQPHGGDPSPWDTYAGAAGTPPPPPPDDQPTRVMPAADPYGSPYDRTVVQPAAAEPVVPVVPVAPAVAPVPHRVIAAPVPQEPVYLADPDGRRAWPIIAAAIALIVGGLAGYLIGHSTGDDEDSITASTTTVVPTDGSLDPQTQAAVDQQLNSVFTFLAAQAQQPGGIQTPTQYPALDELLGVLASTESSDTTAPEGDDDETAALTAERDQLQAQVTDLQEQLSASQASLEAAQADAGDDGAQAQQVETLQADLDRAKADLATAQSQLDEANQTIADLDPKAVDNVVGVDVANVRSLAESNGWTLVEREQDSTQKPGTVTSQSPPAGAAMIEGSVLYVEVARAAAATTTD